MTRKKFFHVIALLIAVQSVTFADEPVSAQIEFFESRIRPLLVQHCYECHSSAQDPEGGLLLNSRAGVLRGGESGPAVVAGDADQSHLIQAVRYESERQMPPDGKLSEEQIADLEEWVQMGVPDPRDGALALTGIDKLMDDAAGHWAFQPVPAAALPNQQLTVTTPVDAFLLSELQKHGRGFSPRADRRILIRRAYADLIGLPPSPEEVRAFANDSDPDSFEHLVERLLASPHYGERWGRHWLDVARYADNMGAIFNGDDSYPFAYTYRDYVIRSFNEDKPYDRFVIEQLAADLLPQAPDDNRTLAALGFLTVGRRTDRRVDDDVYDDRIDVITRGLMGLTAACARCHHHKLEPITQFDYYAMYGILSSCREADLYPLLKPQPYGPVQEEYEQKNQQVRQAYAAASLTAAGNVTADVRSRVGDYLLTAHESGWKTISDDKSIRDVLKQRKLQSEVHDAASQSRESWLEAHTDVFSPWLAFIDLPADDFATKASELSSQFSGGSDPLLHPLVAGMFEGDPPGSLEELAQRYSKLFAAVDAEWRQLATEPLREAAPLRDGDLTLPGNSLGPEVITRLDEVEAQLTLPDASREALRQVLIEKASPVKIAPDRYAGAQLFPEEDQEKLDELADSIAKLEAHPGAPVRLMALMENQPGDVQIFLRGNPKTRGETAPRRFLEVLAGPDRPVLSKSSSGRLELALEIASPDNPLTARVFVNRVWQWHFGRALVRSPSDFGLRGESPTHPELLDWLAATFVEEGWSIKQLHRQLLMTDAWQQRSNVPTTMRQTDPENRLLGWMNPRALEFEPFRDSLLAVSGRLDSAVGGKPVDLSDHTAVRRTIYGAVDRKSLPNLFRTFDFPDPNFSSAGRNQTALTPQSLYLLNSPCVADCARSLAERSLAAGSGPEFGQRISEQNSLTPGEPANRTANAERVKALFQIVLQRDPTDVQLSQAVDFLGNYPEHDVVMPEVAAWSYGFGDYDDHTQTAATFTLLEFSDGTVKGTEIGELDLTALELTAHGGTAAAGKATIRRWFAPFDGRVDIYAELIHSSDSGDGVKCLVVSSRTGLLGQWAAANSSQLTVLTNVEVRQGETLDFVTAGVKGPKAEIYSEPESFNWAPTVTIQDRYKPGMPGSPLRWDARHDFMDPAHVPLPLTAWEELAQVLLLSNEFAWVD